MSRFITALFVGLVLLSAGRSAISQESSRGDFNEFRDAMVGRWVGEVTWIADFPGFGKRGDKVTCYCEITPMDDGKAILGRFFGGEGSGTWLTVYDVSAKQIRETSINSDGTTWTIVYYKKDGKWMATQSGSNADGSKIEGKLMVTITDGGNTHTWTGTTKIGGKKVDDLNDKWHRVSKAHSTQDTDSPSVAESNKTEEKPVDGEKSFRSYTDFAIGGVWVCEIDGMKLEDRYEPILNGKYVRLTSVASGDLPAEIMILGVDPVNNQFTWWGFGGDGSTMIGTSVQESDSTWTGQNRRSGPQGSSQSRGRLTKVDADTIKYQVLERKTDGDTPTLPTETIWKRKR